MFIMQWMIEQIIDITAEPITGYRLSPIVQLLVILVIAFTARWLLKKGTRLLTRKIQKLDNSEDSEFDRRTATIFRIVYSAGLFIIFITSLLMILDILAIDITPILASLGILGLAIGLGVQTLIKDVVSGLFILIENQYLVGDNVELNKISGTVETITIRVTKVRDLYGTLHAIPNGDIRTVSNRSRGWGRAVIDVGITYDSDVDRAIQVMQDVGLMLRQDMVLGALMIEDPQVTGVEGLEDWSVRLRLMVKTLPGQQNTVQRQLRQHIHRIFAQKGIEIAFPRQEIQLVEGSKQ